MAEIVEHEDGVFLNMPMDRYQRDTALGSGGIKQCANNPVKWWWKSAFNTIDPQQVETEAGERGHYRLGTAVHVATLDGKDASLDVYEAAYGVVPSTTTHPKALVTDAHVKAELAKMHLRPVPGEKARRVEQLMAADPEAQVLDVLVEEFHRSGRSWVTASEDARVRLLHGMITMSPEKVPLVEGEAITLRDVFRGGLSEVSVFWTDENDIRQRGRLDYAKPRVTVDLKTFADWRDDLDFGPGLLREAWFRGYVTQWAHYDEARRQLRRLVAEGKVFGGTPEQRALLEEIAASDVWAWLWVFCITDGAPIVKGVRPDPGGIHYAKGVRQRETALTNFLYYRELFGLEPGQMWFDPVAIWTPEESDWPFTDDR